MLCELLSWIFQYLEGVNHSTIKILCNYNSLNWINTSILYHLFPKLGVIMKEYLVTNILEDLSSRFFFNGECSFSSTAKVDCKCAYISECRGCFIVYKVMCNIFDSIYIGKSQNDPNKIIEQHFQDVAK